ncbi:hypothetical protein KFE98_08825 [bacterium SCSIO 12741]|nr:hypothetical protein KFE98_08825 [bacterium SCSIO 12741]
MFISRLWLAFLGVILLNGLWFTTACAQSGSSYYDQYTAQGKYRFFGQIHDHFEVTQYLKGATIRIRSEYGGELVLQADEQGEFETTLDFGVNYVVFFEDSGYVTKYLAVELQDAEEKYLDPNCTPYPIRVSMLEDVDGVDYHLFENPVGSIVLDPDNRCFDWVIGMSEKDYSRLIRTVRKKSSR